MSDISFSGYVTSMPDHFLTQGFPGDPTKVSCSYSVFWNGVYEQGAFIMYLFSMKCGNIVFVL